MKHMALLDLEIKTEVRNLFNMLGKDGTQFLQNGTLIFLVEEALGLHT